VKAPRSLPKIAAAARWPPAVALATLLVVGALLPERYGLLPTWLKDSLWALSIVLVAISTWAHLSPTGQRFEVPTTRATLAIVTAVMTVTLGRVVFLVFLEGSKVPGIPLLSTGISYWLANQVVFALWYWSLDRGGPQLRASSQPEPPDLLFPQATLDPNWRPTFFDYIFVAFSASTAFSPTDTAPLTPRAKLLMMAQAGVALVTVVIVVARAVSLLG
jgi:hypothetical protein